MAKTSAVVKNRDRICRLAGFGRGDPWVWVEGEHFIVHATKAPLAIQRLTALGYGVMDLGTFYGKGPLGRQTRLAAFDITLPEHTPGRRARTVARIKAGLARARAEGTRLGRPPTPEETVEKIRVLLAQGVRLRAIAATVQVGLGTVARIKRDVRE